MTQILAAFLPAGLILLMFVVGLRLSLDRVGAAFRHPKALFTGLVVQMLLLPASAFMLVRLFGLSTEMSIGLVLVAAAPGGVTSNYIAWLARADVALSAAMTLVTTSLAAVTIPAILMLAGVAALPGVSGLAKMSMAMSAVALVPMAIGIGFAAWRPETAKRLGNILDPVSKLIFAAMVLATFVQNWGAITDHLSSVGPAVVALNLIALGLAGGAGMLMGLNTGQRRAIMVEASLQNVAVAMFVAGSLLKNPALATPALIYALVMNISALVQISMAHRRAVSVSGT